MSRELRLNLDQWEKIRRVREYAMTDPFYNVRDTLLRLGESWGYSEGQLITAGIIAPRPKVRPGALKGARKGDGTTITWKGPRRG